MNEAAQGAAADFARRMVPFWQQALGADLIGVYLLGSLAHGGFSARYSDVDMAVVTESGIPQPVLDRTRAEAVALSAEWGPKLSVFWADRAFGTGRFPPLDRLDYLDHAVAVTERERVKPARPTLDEVRRYLAGAPFSGWAEEARRFAAAGSLDPKDRKPYLRALLYPARFCFSFVAGRMGSNGEAVVFLAKSAPAGLDVGLIARALEIRQTNADPDSLFSERHLLPAQVAACAALIGTTDRPSQGGRA
jgi:predicted nucleotidyltransferase